MQSHHENIGDFSKNNPLFAHLARDEHKHLLEAASLTRSILHNGRNISISEFSEFLQEIMQDSVERIVSVSKQAVVMLYSLQNLDKDLEFLAETSQEMEEKITKIEAISKEMLQVSAKRKPEKKILENLANEMAKSCQALADACEKMKARKQITLERSTKIEQALESVASMDITKNLVKSEELQKMMTAFDNQQLKLYTSLINAVRVNKKLQDL